MISIDKRNSLFLFLIVRKNVTHTQNKTECLLQLTITRTIPTPHLFANPIIFIATIQIRTCANTNAKQPSHENEYINLSKYIRIHNPSRNGKIIRFKWLWMFVQQRPPPPPPPTYHPTNHKRLIYPSTFANININNNNIYLMKMLTSTSAHTKLSL